MAEIYLDHAATTAVLPEVAEAMQPYYTQEFYNPSGNYQPGRRVRETLQRVRETIAEQIHAEAEEIYFTSGGTEADNWVLNIMAKTTEGTPGHIITSAIEHHAIGHTCEHLKAEGCRITVLPVDRRGRIRVRDIEDCIQDNTTVISVMYANNEIGTIQPIDAIGAVAEKHGILFHTDAVQACGQLPIDVKKSGITMLSASAHKFHGPKGVGFLYVKKGVPIHNFIEGGGQERGLRAGTENVPGIVGMGKALELAGQTMEERAKKETVLRDYMLRRLLTEIPYTIVNGHLWYRLPNNVNVAFRFVNASALLELLDMEGIQASGGSACNSKAKGQSHVIQALQLPEAYRNGVLRFTLGEENTMEEIDRVMEVLKRRVHEMRDTSPEYEDYLLSVDREKLRCPVVEEGIITKTT